MVQRLAEPGRADLAGGLIAHGEDEVQFGRAELPAQTNSSFVVLSTMAASAAGV
jgi:hypothetical protein